MGVHQVTDKRGYNHLVHTGYMRYWVCGQCGYPCGYTWAVAGTIRNAFCRACDSVTEQTSMVNKL